MGKILLVLAIVLCVLLVKAYIEMETNKKILLTSSDKIPLETVLMFSLYEFTKRLKRYYGKAGKTILIEYADDKWAALNTRDSQAEMIEVLEEAQGFMISKRYDPDENYVVKDSINKIMYDLWLDYAYKGNYSVLFWREINEMYSKYDISKSTYNEVYRRFYKYKYLENK